jgi:hypothetical protein
MADQRFFNAFLTPARTIILGKKLKPFSLKHRIFLEGIGSPYLQSDQELTPADLLIAIKICADESLDRFTFWDRLLGLRMTLSKKLFAQASLSFVRYVNQPDTYPKFYEKKEAGSSAEQMPWQLCILATLIRNGISYEAALTMPEAKAIWLSTAFNIQAGAKLELLTTDDEDLIDRLKAEMTSPKPG